MIQCSSAVVFWGMHPVLYCVTSSSFAGNDELVAVEDSIDVGNVL